MFCLINYYATPPPPPASHHSSTQMPPLRLIRCPECNAGNVLWFVSGTVENPGRHFYKCERHGVSISRFFASISPSRRSSSQSNFLLCFSSLVDAVSGSGRTSTYSTSPRGHLILRAPLHRHVSLLEQNQTLLKNTFILGLVNLLAMAMIFFNKLKFIPST